MAASTDNSKMNEFTLAVEPASAQGHQGDQLNFQAYDRTMSIFCPPIATPLAEMALHWDIDSDRRLVHSTTWPDTPAPWDAPNISPRPSTSRAEPLLPPVDASDEVPLPFMSGSETFPDRQSSGNTSYTTRALEKTHRDITSSAGSPMSRGAQLGRSLTNAFRKKPQPLQSIRKIPTIVSNTDSPITTPLRSELQPPTPDPRSNAFPHGDPFEPRSRADVHFDKSENLSPRLHFFSKHRYLPDRNLRERTHRDTNRTPASLREDYGTPPSRRTIHVLWRGRRWKHDVGCPEHYVDSISRMR